MLRSLAVLISAALGLASCPNIDFVYDFEAPDATLTLADDLREASGLTLLPDGRLGVVQDERGVLYIVDPETGRTTGFSRFGRNGDYEAVEAVDESVFVLRSDGLLLEMEGWGRSEVSVRSHETGLEKDNDTEGLAYDARGGRLLIACKEEPGGGLGGDDRAIYAFDLAAGALVEEPVFSIDLDDVEEFTDDDAFKPSAIAVHPVTGEVYVLSSSPRALAVLDRGGRLLDVTKLDGDLFEQPEGLAFLPDGTLFIGSEGVDAPAVIRRFRPR